MYANPKAFPTEEEYEEEMKELLKHPMYSDPNYNETTIRITEEIRKEAQEIRNSTLHRQNRTKFRKK